MTTQHLQRSLRLHDAVMLGLGSIVGTGVFVSIAIAAGITGPAVILAVAAGALVASFNGLSSAQLAANHPVSGGTYEYGYKFLHPMLGFTAGFAFLLAKSASAATAALGFSGYLLGVIRPLVPSWLEPIEIFSITLSPLALLAVAGLLLITLTGIKRSSLVNTIIVSITLLILLALVVAGLLKMQPSNFQPFFASFQGTSQGAVSWREFLYATALMFVAYTGYGRIATLGEEVHEPRRTIPRAIIVTLLVTMTLYLLIAVVSVGVVGLPQFALSEAPLELVGRYTGVLFLWIIVAFGAVTAMLSVLLNLILGLSRVLLAMGRRRDMPAIFAKLNAKGTAPVPALIAVGGVIALLTLLGDVKTTWGFSAFTVLIYYSITNLAALFIPTEARFFPRWVSVAGLLSCLGLAFFVPLQIWVLGLAMLALGLLWFFVAKRLLA